MNTIQLANLINQLREWTIQNNINIIQFNFLNERTFEVGFGKNYKNHKLFIKHMVDSRDFTPQRFYGLFEDLAKELNKEVLLNETKMSNEGKTLNQQSLQIKQEAIKPTIRYWRPNLGTHYSCGNCNADIGHEFESMFCKKCGRPVKWCEADTQ